MVSVIGHKLQRVLLGFGFVVAQYWAYIILDEIMVTKIIQMTITVSITMHINTKSPSKATN